MPTARMTFWWGRRFVAEGQEVDASDPVVKGREHLFMMDTPVEQATAAPGEKRPVKPHGEVACPVDGCDYTGTERGLSIHTARSHD